MFATCSSERQYSITISLSFTKFYFKIVIEYCRSEEQVANIFTKPLKVDSFLKLKKTLDMMSYGKLGVRGVIPVRAIFGLVSNPDNWPHNLPALARNQCWWKSEPFLFGFHAKKKKRNIIVPVAASVATSLVLIVAALAIFFILKRRRQQVLLGGLSLPVLLYAQDDQSDSRTSMILSWEGRLRIAVESAQEIITSKSPIIRTNEYEKTHLSQWVDSLLAQGDIRNIVDSRLQGDFDINSVWKAVEVAMACLSPSANKRPSMTVVVMELNESLATEMARIYQSGSGYDSKDSIDPMISMDLGTEINPGAR
ncbi:hypothetical protein EZV62_003674 [Acer yangbiense]|uniref:Serine-threonine/tyrosine-protein kinase catalytic domain-containing protein n=1 Tax=Acer yangbiense TaxID=1000413 RepID=A0A5C7II36_9ROSI|nr:hypothetical protein EZV62_003674 [Acer yangbiense]